MHIAPYDNQNRPIVDIDDATVPLNYFNIVKLKRGEAFEYQTPGYETCIAPATGTVDVDVEGVAFAALGNRGEERLDVHDDAEDGENRRAEDPTKGAQLAAAGFLNR